MKRLFFVYAGILLFLVTAAGIVALGLQLARGPSTVLTNPCDPPCWYGIQPGETTSMDALSILTELPWASGIRERTTGYLRGEELIHLEWSLGSVPDAYAYAYFDDDVCTAISILTYGSLTISDAFERFGEPERMWVHFEELQTREWIEVTLFYSSDGIVIEVDVPAEGAGNYVELLGKNPVARVTYFDPGRFQDLLDTEILINEPSRPGLGSLVSWPGLGAIPYEREQGQ